MDIDIYRGSITRLVGHREDAEKIICGLLHMRVPLDLAYSAAISLLRAGAPTASIQQTIENVWNACPEHQREAMFCACIGMLCARIAKGLPI